MSCIESLEGTVIDPELLRFFNNDTPKILPDPEVPGKGSARLTEERAVEPSANTGTGTGL